LYTKAIHNGKLHLPRHCYSAEERKKGSASNNEALFMPLRYPFLQATVQGKQPQLDPLHIMIQGCDLYLLPCTPFILSILHKLNNGKCLS